MNDEWIAGLYLAGLGTGLLMGWLIWRMPMLHAEQRGRELQEDGYCIRIVKCERNSTGHCLLCNGEKKETP